MLIRAALVMMALAACAQPIPSTPDASIASNAEVEQPVINTCNPVNYPCDPLDPLADRICQLICDDNGNEGYCLEYSSVELIWCAAHPDQFFQRSPIKLCSPSGEPTWLTHCEPGWLP